ncbi:MAG: (2Fe-2S)-binding protein [Deltaproteobacteria bacterium]|nr:(2Fe-2S)-binding protein [Deltaproteobacteria bacterium]MBN2671191.1 (2Fe-2S)-binding protein [Deltaproteobacteria bacterium]
MTVEFTINGVNVEAAEGESLLEVIRRYGFEVPSLCHHHAVEPYGACRVCLVAVTDKRGRTKLTTSCNYQVASGIAVQTESEEIRRNRALVIELMLAEAPDAEPLKKLGAEYGVLKSRLAREESKVVEDRDGCILCGLCVRVCTEVVEVSALNFTGRGDKRNVGTPYMETPQNCIACGACAYVCPTNCIGFVEEDGMRKLKKWKRELPMAKGEDGRAVAPKFQLNHFIEKAGLPKDFYKKGGPGSR